MEEYLCDSETTLLYDIDYFFSLSHNLVGQGLYFHISSLLNYSELDDPVLPPHVAVLAQICPTISDTNQLCSQIHAEVIIIVCF